ncbi:alpha/beta hydrolase fold domain-containing protein [Streptomyces sp. 3MP-14]|uniref:Alpha/beta hydrolase fold domain-containing protein n=1 Tax=Streptomyces mimosae TaxID=2586635 RepID=A0A5N6ALP1_9ACTN|nr:MULTISPECIES: alpha/beta hydrolase [Streptomyces]KAB8168528.1 alpha/beta hydrolase fold domain-containing protein [Streptomyces mimosae]KAB8178191.1 alpha/beta hydrolase fold domain-containing protein [Streptomyces sp. 3MP-14]
MSAGASAGSCDGSCAGDPRERWAELDRAARDAAYDNNAAVPDSAALVAARNAAARAYRAAHPEARLDLPYGPRPRNRCDLFPAADPAAPCLVFLHGGWWQRNGREDFSHLAEGMRHFGWSAALPGYSLAPAASLTEIVAETWRALDWLVAEGPAFGVAGPLVIAGWSAGAQLAALALPHSGARAGLAISGAHELAPLRDTWINEALRLTAEEAERLSPLRHPPSPKPLTVACGAAELPTLVADARRLHGLRAAAGAPGELLVLPGRDHFTVLEELRSPGGALTRAVLRLLEP